MSVIETIFRNNLFSKTETKLSDQKDQRVPQHAGDWIARNYKLPDLQGEETITGVEELVYFIMHDGCTIQWQNPVLKEYCERSADNFAWACRYVAWCTLGSACDYPALGQKLKDAYFQWRSTSVTSEIWLKWGSSVDEFTWSIDEYGFAGWVTEVLLNE